MLEVINSFIWRLGGSVNKNIRRLGFPLLLVLVFVWTLPIWKLLLLAISCHLATRLPLTLIGNDIPKHWFNWIWVWIAGYLLGLPSVIVHGYSGFLYALIPFFGQGISVTLSNLKRTRTIFVHEFCEAVIGASAMASVIGGF